MMNKDFSKIEIRSLFLENWYKEISIIIIVIHLIDIE